MSISSGLLGLWQEVARSDSWATESRSARCAEDWTAEAGEGQLARLGAGCSGGGEWAVRRRSAARMSRPIARLCTRVATQQCSNAAQAVHARGGGEVSDVVSESCSGKGGDDEGRLLADAVLRGASVGQVEAQLQGRSQMEMSRQWLDT